MKQYHIREMKPSEYPLLERFTYESVFQTDEKNPPPYEIVNVPEIKAYYDGFGKPDDHCLVAESGGRVVGAVWARIISGEVKGYGNVDAETPEFGIALFKEYRNMGIGTALMKGMLGLLKERGYRRASLSVQRANDAARLYERLGFQIVREMDEEYIMVYPLNEA